LRGNIRSKEIFSSKGQLGIAFGGSAVAVVLVCAYVWMKKNVSNKKKSIPPEHDLSSPLKNYPASHERNGQDSRSTVGTRSVKRRIIAEEEVSTSRPT
jgi:hypothetical protein